MGKANTDGDGLPAQPVVMRLTEGAVPASPDRYADLLPCPFCGAIPITTDYEDCGWDGNDEAVTTHYEIHCEQCRYSMPSEGWFTLIELQARWNTRTWQATTQITDGQ